MGTIFHRLDFVVCHTVRMRHLGGCIRVEYCLSLYWSTALAIWKKHKLVYVVENGFSVIIYDELK